MKSRFAQAFVTSIFSILPVAAIVVVLSLSNLAPIGNNFVRGDLGFENYVLLGIGVVVMIFGLALFQKGADRGLTKVGEYMGASLSKQKNLFVVIVFSFLLGTLITCAEPSILIIANQVQINKWVLILSIALGVGVFVVIGILRTIFQKSLKVWYLLFYLIVFLMMCLLEIDVDNHAFLPFIFDAGGITTGSATVPFILALGTGVAVVRGGKNSHDSSFGLVGLASVGPILTMTLLIIFHKSGFSNYVVPEIDTSVTILNRFLNALLPFGGSLGSLIEVLMALLPILVIFFVYELIFIKLPGKKVGQVMIGFLTSFIGLVFFLTATGAAMSPIGLLVGKALGNQPEWVIILVSFVIGLVTILCEPAVHVLTSQVETISDGQLKKPTTLFALSIGVGVAICLAMIRTLFGFSIMWYIVPGYTISFILMFIVPDIYTAIAFDSGGTASGPMAVSFVLPLIVGVFSTKSGLNEGVEFYSNSFGVVALIALTPIIAVQTLGLVTKFKQTHALRVMRMQLRDERNNEIIHFN